MRLRTGHELPRTEVGRARQRASALRGEQAGLDGPGHAAGDLVLHGKDVAELPIVALGPVMGTGQRIDQLGRDAQALAGPAHAAFEHIAHAQLARDPLHVDDLALVGECRVAGDDEQPADAGEPGDQVLGDSIGKVLLL
jgi:hypothetical protein